jgi:hypothetical protein
MYAPLLSPIHVLVLDEGGWLKSCPGHCPSGMSCCPLCRRLGRPQCSPDGCGKSRHHWDSIHGLSSP